MPLVVNGITIPTNVANVLMVNGVSVTQVIANGVVVWAQSLGGVLVGWSGDSRGGYGETLDTSGFLYRMFNSSSTGWLTANNAGLGTGTTTCPFSVNATASMVTTPTTVMAKVNSTLSTTVITYNPITHAFSGNISAAGMFGFSTAGGLIRVQDDIDFGPYISLT